MTFPPQNINFSNSETTEKGFLNWSSHPGKYKAYKIPPSFEILSAHEIREQERCN